MTVSKRLLFSLCFLFLWNTGCSEKEAEEVKPDIPDVTSGESTFTNPLLPRAADPWVIEKDGTYYFTYTQGSKLVLQATKKMSELANASVVTLWTPPANTPYSQNIWAPELHFLQGKWYMYFAADNGSNANHRMYVIENASPNPTSKTWQYKGKVTDKTDNWAIDGTVFEHEGQLYFIWSGWETSAGGRQDIYIAEMSNPWTIDGDRVKLSSPQYVWEMHGGAINEGPQFLKGPTGKVFIVYSASSFSSDDYALGLLTLTAGGNPLNPADWQKMPQPVFTKKSENGAFGPGHNAFFKTIDGKEDWIIYHARSLPGGGSTNYRNIRMQPYTWNADGTPNFGEPVRIGTKIKKPSGE